jgi:hypothetical protein
MEEQTMETVWSFQTKRFRVELQIEPDYGYEYDGDDEDGETQRKLDNGEYVAFDSSVVVYMDGKEVGRDSLGGSVYEASRESEFWTAHRDPDPMHRNCSIYRDTMRATTGHECMIGHYFPGMVTEAVTEARKALCNVPKLRCT